MWPHQASSQRPIGAPYGAPKIGNRENWMMSFVGVGINPLGIKTNGRDQTSRAISSARLKALQPVHLRPINLVVSQGPLGTLRSRIVHLGDSFPLRCIQRLSAHDVATGRCPWRDSPYTGGRFVPVLSY